MRVDNFQDYNRYFNFKKTEPKINFHKGWCIKLFGDICLRKHFKGLKINDKLNFLIMKILNLF